MGQVLDAGGAGQTRGATDPAADPRARALQYCRRFCSRCGKLHQEEPQRCSRCGKSWSRPGHPADAERARVFSSWARELRCLQRHLPEGVSLGRAKICFSSELQTGALAELVDQAARTAARFFYATDRDCYTLLALRTAAGVVGALTDFPWRSRPAAAGYGDPSGDCLVFAAAEGGCSAFRCRNSHGAVMHYSGDALEFGRNPGRDGGAAISLRASLRAAHSAPSGLFGSPSLLGGGGGGDLPVSGVLCLSWAHLEGEALETLPLALRQNQDTFMLNFISSSVRNQVAVKGGSAWS